MAWQIGIAYFLVLISGITGLVYQVVWHKYLAMFLGGHALATSLVLAGFFGFLALGYGVIGRLVPLTNLNRIKIYAWLEFAIGAYALISPQYFDWLRENQGWSAQLNPYIYNLIMTALLLAVPTFLMGGTIPVLTEGLSQGFEGSHRVHARVYSVNTLGAFVGALVAGFYLIENLGLPLTLNVAGVANVVVGMGALLVAWTRRIHAYQPPLVTKTPQARVPPRTRWLLYGVSALSGFYVFTLETVLIRMAGISLGSTVYTYSMIVAAFIVAIALGAGWAGRFDTGRHSHYLLWSQLVLILSALVLYKLIPNWPDFFYRVRSIFYPSIFNFDTYWYTVTGFLILILLVPVGLMGANLPLLFGYFRRRQDHFANVVGRLYAANSIGSVLGASVGGYFLFLVLSADQIFKVSITLMAANLIMLGVLTLSKFRRTLLMVPTVILAGICWSLDSWSPHRFLPARSYAHLPPRENDELKAFAKAAFDPTVNKVLYYEDDPNTTVSVSKSPLEDYNPTFKVTESLNLNVNSKPDASIPGDHYPRALLPLIGTTLAPNVSEVFIVGLGAGLSTAVTTTLTEVQHVDVAEISSGVINALRFFDEFNKGLLSRSDKFRVINDDAFRVMKGSNKKYGLILSEPSNPWVTGVERLFSLEFFKMVHDHLTEDGVFGQWLALSAVSEGDVASILRTLRSIFPYVSVWNSSGGAISIFASKAELKFNDQVIRPRHAQLAPFFEYVSLEDPSSIMALQLLPAWSVDGISQTQGPLQLLESQQLAFSAARGSFANLNLGFDVFLATRFQRPIPFEVEKSLFYFDQYPGRPFSTAFLNSTLNFYRLIGSFTSANMQLRWKYEAHKAGLGSPKDSAPSKWIAWILGDDPHPPQPMRTAKNAPNGKALTAYQKARLMFYRPKVERLLQSTDVNCKQPVCLKYQLAILHEVLPLKDPFRKRKLNLQLPEDQNLVQKRLAEEIKNLQSRN